MILNFAPLGWSCWYSTPMKDGVLKEEVFQAFRARVCLLVSLLRFTVAVYQHCQPTFYDRFIEMDIQRIPWK